MGSPLHAGERRVQALTESWWFFPCSEGLPLDPEPASRPGGPSFGNVPIVLVALRITAGVTRTKNVPLRHRRRGASGFFGNSFVSQTFSEVRTVHDEHSVSHARRRWIGVGIDAGNGVRPAGNHRQRA